MSNFTVDFATADFSDSRPYLLILDQNGEPIFHRSIAAGSRIADFKTFGNGLLGYYQAGIDEWVIMNDAYEIVDKYEAVGYPIDGHEFLLMPNGHAIFYDL